MAKKYFEIPFVLLTRGPGDDPGEESEQGYGSDMGSTDPYACSFDEWMSVFHVDMDNDGDTDRDDYRAWWTANNLGEDAWSQFNP